MGNQEKNIFLLYKLFKPEKLSTLVFYLTILFFVIAFNFRDTPTPSGWYQQFMPNLNGRQIVDITFTDSLNGYAITSRLSTTDTSFILKTTNSGDNWFVSHMDSGFIYKRVQFLNQNTGYVGGTYLIKTTNAGLNWSNVNMPFQTYIADMSIRNIDTIWFAMDESLTGGVFRTTNGGTTWTAQYSGQNPSHIYMFNARIGFIDGGAQLRRTTDGGFNWIPITGEGSSFTDMYFIDSLTGWRSPPMKKTTDGGMNWVEQTLPQGGNLIPEGNTFSVINKDTIWADGGYKFIPGNGNSRGILDFTSNGGVTWYFQIPDTSFGIFQYPFVRFTNKRTGWAYSIGSQGGIHTKTGGDTIFYTGIRQISNIIPKDFSVEQNYPNPFNPRTIIPYSLKKSAYVKILVYDILGKGIDKLVDQKQNAGKFEVDFMGKFISSGVYFYTLMVDDKLIETKKMILLK